MGRSERRVIVGVTGASGSVYARRLIDLLEQASCHVEAIFSDPAKAVFAEELGISHFNSQTLLGRESDRLRVHSNSNLFSELASGSVLTEAMVICPCSAHSLGSLAAGLADTLLLRSAYVTLKERRRLVIVSREMPLTSIDLANMQKLTQAGAIICPASPGFYKKPKSIDDLVDFIVGRLLDLLNIKHDLNVRWRE
jgi:4-hydroxy-3-polyprenylbenzoate decarboxylase